MNVREESTILRTIGVFKNYSKTTNNLQGGIQTLFYLIN